MSHYGALKETRFADASEDIRGSHLYGLNDEKLGKIDDVIFDHSTGVIRYVVVVTGGWLTSQKFIVPADGLRASAKHTDDFEVSLTKNQIESFPPYDDSVLESERKWTDYEGHYRSKWVADPVMHRAETRPQHYSYHPADPRKWLVGTGRGRGARVRAWVRSSPEQRGTESRS